MINANIGWFDMEIFVEIDFVSAFLPFHMAGQCAKPSQITALIERQTFIGINSPAFDYLTGNGFRLHV